jgi:hypothetical protein
MVNHPPSATERAFAISAFENGVAVAAIARQIGKHPGSVAWLLKTAGLKGNARSAPVDLDSSDAAHDPAQSFPRCDRAFQRAMRRAIAAGREHPPMIGVFKDERPLEAPRRFEPVPRSSGCTSPALMCAELETPAPADPQSPGCLLAPSPASPA